MSFWRKILFAISYLIPAIPFCVCDILCIVFGIWDEFAWERNEFTFVISLSKYVVKEGSFDFQLNNHFFKVLINFEISLKNFLCLLRCIWVIRNKLLLIFSFHPELNHIDYLINLLPMVFNFLNLFHYLIKFQLWLQIYISNSSLIESLQFQ